MIVPKLAIVSTLTELYRYNNYEQPVMRHDNNTLSNNTNGGHTTVCVMMQTISAHISESLASLVNWGITVFIISDSSIPRTIT